MPKDIDSTIKFKADITDLKASMQEAGRYIRLANSEFKAATAGMDNWAKSADGLSAKTKQLNTILQAQKQQLAALQTDYARVVKEQGENSKGAEELKIKINNQTAAIAQTQSQLDKYEKELKDVSNETEKAGDAAEEAANGGFTVLKGVMANLAAQGVTALANGLKNLVGTLIDVGKQAVSSYAQFEQLEGGVSKLFGTGGQTLEEYAASIGKTTEMARGQFHALEEAQDAVMKNAQNAYKTAGMSANQYMETVTNFSAALIEGLDGNTQAAIQYADMAIRDMSDNANTFGTDISMIQNAYQGFAKQNYTMLDNLKLGYGGNATEMARLINESGVLGDSIEVTAETVKEVPFDKIIEAINVTQQRMKITGTTAREAGNTIEGSVGSMQAAWENLLTGMANDNADFGTLMNNFIASLMGTVGNLIPRIKTVMSGIGQLVMSLVEELFPVVIDLINEQFPDLVEMGGKLLVTIVTGIIDALPQLANTAIEIVTQLIRGLGNALPQIIYAIVNAVPQIVQAILTQLPVFLRACISFLMAIVQAIPTVVRAISIQLPQIINAIVSTLIESIPIILNGAVQLLGGLISAIPVIIEALGTALPTIIDAITQGLVDGLPLILEGAISIFMTLIEAIPVILDALTENLPKIIEAIVNSFIKALPVILEASITLLMSLIDALPTIIRALVVNLPKLISTIISVLLENLPVLISASIQLFMGLLEAIPVIIVELAKNLPEIIKAVVDGLGEGLVDIINVGESLIEGLWKGISNMGDWIGEKIKGFGEGVVDDLKTFFGIGSPSKLFRDEIGKWLPPGITVGFEKAMPQAIKNMANSAKEMAKDIADEMATPLEDMAISADQVKGIQSISGNSGSFGTNASGSVNGNKSIVFNQTINSPEPISRLTVFRDTNSLLFSAGVKLNNV